MIPIKLSVSKMNDTAVILHLEQIDNKHLMTGPKGNSFPETLNVPRGEAEGNIEVEGKQTSLFPCFVIPPNLK